MPFFILAGGDNAAEGQQSVIKNQMRRFGVIGKKKNKDKNNVGPSIDVLFGAAMAREAGLMRVLRALKCYRVACSSGNLKIAPRHAFTKSELPWVYW